MSILLDVEILANSCINDEIEREFMINGLIDILVRIPTCTATERMFLDEIREKGVLFKYKTASNAIGIGSTIIDQVDFKTNIENLTNEIH